MPFLPIVTARQLVKLIKAIRFIEVRQKGEWKVVDGKWKKEIPIQRPQSKIVNNGSESIGGGLMMNIEKKVNNQWENYVGEFTFSKLIPANNLIKLDSLWCLFDVGCLAS